MSLEKRCAEAFEEVQRNAGFHDFMEDRITLVDRREGVVEAWAFGGGDLLYPLTVDWRREGEGILVVACDCPSFQEGGACHHLWAAILTLDQELGRNLVPGTGPLRLERSEVPASPLSTVEVPGEDWRRQLELVADLQRAVAVARATESAEAGAEGGPLLVWYRLDLPASEHSGRLTLEVLTTHGDRGLRPPPPAGLPGEALTEAEDRWLVELLAALPAPGGRPRAALPGALCELVLPRLCATGRFGWQPRPTVSAGTLQPLAWQQGEPWRFALGVDSETPDRIALTGRLRRGEEERSLREPLLLLPAASLVIFPHHIAPFHLGEEGPWITVLRQVGRIRVPAAEVPDLRYRLAALPRPPSEAIRFP